MEYKPTLSGWKAKKISKDKNKNNQIPIPVNVVNSGKFWLINLPHEEDKLPEIESMIVDERKKHTNITYSKSLQMNYNNYITQYQDIIDTLNNLYNTMGTMFRLLFSFGYAIEKQVEERDQNGNIINDYYIYYLFTPERNYFFDENIIIKNKKDFENKILSQITKDDIIEHLKQEAEVLGSKVRILGIYAIGIKITILDHPIGSNVKLPDHIKKSKNIIGLEGIENNLCFWACIALADGVRKDRYIRKAEQLFRIYYGNQEDINKYSGFDFNNELNDYESFNTKYAINILSYNEDKTAQVIRHSQFNDSRTKIYLNLYMDHFSYIGTEHKLKKLIQFYLCTSCAKKFKDNRDLKRHQDCCSTTQKNVFTKYPQIYEPNRNKIIELADYFGIDIDFKYEYLIVYDLESVLLKVKQENKKSHKTIITHKHNPVSFSVFDNIPGFSEEYWYCDNDPKELVINLFSHLDNLTTIAGQLMKNKMKPLIEAVEKYYNKKRRIKYLKEIDNYCKLVPIIGFNSGFYDAGIMLNSNFMGEILKRDKKPMVIKCGNRYKVIQAGNFLFLDQVQYLSAGTSLNDFMKAFEGGETKGFFPHEFLDTYKKLDYPFADLKREHFYSTLKNTIISQEEYDWLMNFGRSSGWQTIKDNLKWYNNRDVRPFLKACLNQKEYFYPLKLEMYKDGYSLPALSEKIMFSYSLKDFDEFKNLGIEQARFTMPPNIKEKIVQYKVQDHKAKRNLDNFITEEQVEQLIAYQSFKCYYCHKCLNAKTWTLDRIECDKAHIGENCIVACDLCNKHRNDELFNKFKRKKALLRFSKTHPMIYLIDEENKEVFYKLKENITGGASLVFHRYHEAEKTKITRVHYDTEKKDWFIEDKKDAKLVKKIVGFDANALYLYCIGQDIPCGILKWLETNDLDYYMKLTLAEEFFGFLEVDIEVPEEKKNYFSEMWPIHKNITYSQEEAGEFMTQIIKQNGGQPKKVRKLIGSLKGSKILIKSTRLKWLIEHGCIVTKLYGVIKAQRGRPFKSFMEKVAEERRKGDADTKYAIIAEMWKLVGNSAFGRTGMNKNKHKTVKYCNENQFNRKKFDYFYYDANLYGEVYEVFSNKRKVKQNIPIQVASSIYDDSKKRMLEFYYDCVDKYLDRSDFQYISMDTDSAYMALTGDIEDLVKPKLLKDFIKNYNKWFPRTDDEYAAYDRRTPGLFKIEFVGIAMIALCPKMYYVLGDKKDKFSCKAIQQKINKVRTNFLIYKDVLFSGKQNMCKNRGFKFIKNEIVTYEVTKIGLTSVYDKAYTMNDGFHLRPLDI